MTIDATNGYDPKRIQEVTDDILGLHDQIARNNTANGEKNAAVRANIGHKYKEAKKAWGINTAALKFDIRRILDERKAQEAREALDDEIVDALDLIAAARRSLQGDKGLDGSPLGEAAVKATADAVHDNGASRLAGLRKPRQQAEDASLDAAAQ